MPTFYLRQSVPAINAVWATAVAASPVPSVATTGPTVHHDEQYKGNAQGWEQEARNHVGYGNTDGLNLKSFKDSPTLTKFPAANRTGPNLIGRKAGQAADRSAHSPSDYAGSA